MAIARVGCEAAGVGMSSKKNWPWEKVEVRAHVRLAAHLGPGVQQGRPRQTRWRVAKVRMDTTRWDRQPHLIKATLIDEHTQVHKTASLLGEYVPCDDEGIALFVQLHQSLLLYGAE